MCFPSWWSCIHCWIERLSQNCAKLTFMWDGWLLEEMKINNYDCFLGLGMFFLSWWWSRIHCWIEKKLYIPFNLMDGFIKLKAEFCNNQPSKEFYKIQPSSINSFTIRSRRQISFTTPNSGHRSVSSLSLGRMYGRPAERTCSFLLLAFVNKHKHIHWERAEVLGESCLISENSMSI